MRNETARIYRFAFVILVAMILEALIIQIAGNANAQAIDPNTEESPAYAWNHMQGNLIAQEKLLHESKMRTPRDTLITNVNVVRLPQGKIARNTNVLVQEGRIAQVGSGAGSQSASNVLVIDGTGKYLAPGLADMHVHTHDDADYLLQLSAGVTSIREMNGWAWRLKRRELVQAGDLLAPNMYITGRIINSSDFGGYAVSIDGPDEARAMVRQTKADGYDAVKIHNGISNEEFHAIVEEAGRVDLKLVGHIPVAVSVTEAVAAGMHTAEHFKGYIDDSRLQIAEDDWVSPSIGMDMYLTPTFYSAREHRRGEDAARIIAEDGHKVPPHQMFAWQEYAAEPGTDGLTQLRQSIRPKSEEIFRTLLPHGVNWLAGTDSGGYALMVPGEALVEELEIMESLGLSPLETLKAATTNAADAMGWQGRTGRIAPGYSADLLLLDKNPLETVSNLRAPHGVMVRGIWIADPAALRLTRQDYQPMSEEISHDLLQAAVEQVEVHDAAGYVQSTMSLKIWVELMEKRGEPDLAQRLKRLMHS